MSPLQKTALFATAQGAVLGLSSYIAGSKVSLTVIAALSITTALVQQAARATFKKELRNKDKLACFLIGTTVSVVTVRCFTDRSLASLAYFQILPLALCINALAKGVFWACSFSILCIPCVSLGYAISYD